MIIAVDFDGTIVEHRYPSIGKELPFAIETLRKLTEEGHQLILWTVREGRHLDEAVEFCRSRGLEFYAVNRDYPEEEQEHNARFSRKLKADLWTGTLGVPLGGTRRVGGLLGVAGRLSGTVSPFRAEQGTSLETPSRARASSCQAVGTTWFFSSCGGILELRRGSQPSPWVGPGKPNLPLGLRGKAGGCARVTAGPKRPHIGVCPGPTIPLQGRPGSRGCIPGSPGESGLVSRGSQGLRSPLESRRGSLGAP